MWNIKYVLLSIFMIILDIYAIRGILLTGKTYYYAGLIVCLLVTTAAVRNCKR